MFRKGCFGLGVVVVLVLIASVDGRSLASRGTGSSDAEKMMELKGNLRHLLQGSSCGKILSSTDMKAATPLNDGKRDITASNGECCALCDGNPECKSWTRIKEATSSNAEGECWLRDHVPEQSECAHCDSGVKETSGDADEVSEDELDQCEADGKFAAKFAFRGACSTLITKCPPPPPTQKRADEPPPEARSFTEGLSASVVNVFERTCKKLFENNCITGGFENAIAKGDACAQILTYGPGNRFGPTPGCEDFNAAVKIFEKEMKELCTE